MSFRRILILSMVMAIAPSVRAEAPIFDFMPALELANTHLELAQNPPLQLRQAVEDKMEAFRKDWARKAEACADPRSAPDQLIQTKAYLQTILRRLTESSKIPAELLNTDYGVCVSPEGGGYGFRDDMRLSSGIILVPPKFMLMFKSEDELAFALAHELAHFLLKHEILYEYLRAGNRSLTGFASVSEREADELGMRIAMNAGYDIDLALSHFKELRKNDVYLAGSQLQSLRNIVMADLQRTKRTYRPRPSEAYLPTSVRNEFQLRLRSQSAGL